MLNFVSSVCVRSLLVGLFLVAAVDFSAADDTEVAVDSDYELTSLGGTFTATVLLGENGAARYSIKHRDVEIIRASALGFVLDGDKPTDRKSVSKGFDRISASDVVRHEATWQPVWGERSTVRDAYRERVFTFESAGRTLKVVFRVYDEGVAFRYIFGKFDKPQRITRELTDFRFVADHDVWAVASAQGKYSKVRLSALKDIVERPCVLETKTGPVIAIAEAELVDYARMRLRRSQDANNTLVVALHGEGKGSPVTLGAAKKAYASPWRVIMAGASPGELLENNDILLNLNTPCQIADTSWIKPGKVIRETSLSTKGAKACVDFCVKYDMQFIEFDAGWYGPERDNESDARTVSKPGLDLQEAIRYANEKGIGVIVYVNRRHLETQLDELLPLYKEWGIAGIKYGFVRVGSQEWTAWLHEAIRKTADHGIMVDVHDEYRMTGWQRTYPNFMTAEGIGGDETRPSNEQALANLFTRMIAAPADHTFCYYKEQLTEKSTHAAQLAKTVCFYSPWQFLFWYDRPAAANDEPELQFIKHLPTTWDDSRVLDGKIGEFGVVARKSGDDWFVGCLNGVKSRTLEVPLSFLDAEATYNAHIYRDAGADTNTGVGVEIVEVNSKTVLDVVMSAKGGMAIRISKRQTSGAP